MAKRKFLRRIWSRYSKLGKKRKKKQVWRKPRGRDNKMREKRKNLQKEHSELEKKELYF
jgi:ribosomal protein L32E